jgi:hypothetical protein
VSDAGAATQHPPPGAPATAAPKDDKPPSPTRSPATTALPKSPPGDVTAGLDCATADHAVAIVNSRGTVIAATPDAGIADTFIWLIILSLAGLAALYPMLATLRLRTEETSGRAELTLSTAVGRVPWGTAHLVIAAVGPALMLASAGLAAGLVHGVVTGDLADQLPRVWAAALVQIRPSG